MATCTLCFQDCSRFSNPHPHCEDLQKEGAALLHTWVLQECRDDKDTATLVAWLNDFRQKYPQVHSDYAQVIAGSAISHCVKEALNEPTRLRTGSTRVNRMISVFDFDRGLVRHIVDLHQLNLEVRKSAYDEALAEVRKEPSNAEVREKAVEAGRGYFGLARDDGQVTTYDEMRIGNDLSAAAAAAAAAMPPAAHTSDVDEVAKKLETLKGLRDRDLITTDEYVEKRLELLSRL